jgi:hypothetical protein
LATAQFTRESKLLTLEMTKKINENFFQ